MTTCFGKSCSFGLLCVSFVKVYQICVCPSLPFVVAGGMWNVIVLIPAHCLSVYFKWKRKILSPPCRDGGGRGLSLKKIY